MATSGPSPSSDSDPDSSRAEASLAPSPPSLAELPPDTLRGKFKKKIKNLKNSWREKQLNLKLIPVKM
jgi:hypothetical protein